MNGLLIEGLSVAFDRGRGAPQLHPVRACSLELAPGEVVGLVGESGCGKSLTALAAMGLLPAGARAEGVARIGGVDLVGAPEPVLRAVRGRRLAMIFQNPMSALNPYFTIGAQIEAVVRQHFALDRAGALARVARALDRVQLPPGSSARYPHQMSGGQLQRAMIAMAVACEPTVLIADEPTTALDVTVQARVMRLLHGLSREGMGLLLITHDLALVAQLADRVVVMYAGRVVESAPAPELFARPAHPYTAALLQTQPRLGAGPGRLPVIEGRVPPADARGRGCAFADRCVRAERRCRELDPPRAGRSARQWVECHRPLDGAATGGTDAGR